MNYIKFTSLHRYIFNCYIFPTSYCHIFSNMVSTRSTPFEQQDDDRDDIVYKKPRLIQRLYDGGTGNRLRKEFGCKAREEANDCFFERTFVSNEASPNCIINVGDLQKMLERSVLCMSCTKKKMIDIMHNAVDDYSGNLESVLGISIPHEVKEDFKKEHILDQQEEHDGRMNLKAENTGLATDIMLTCCNCHHEEIVGANKTVLFEKEKDLTGHSKSKRNKLSWYSANFAIVLASLATGMGGKEASMLLGFLDLPRSRSFGTYSFGKVEAALGDVLKVITEQAMAEALEEEIRLTLEKKREEWLALPEEKKEQEPEPMTYAKYLEIEKEDRPLVAITVSFDAGWQKRNSGSKYDSPSGHGFQVGALC